ncbi:MAG: GTPase HflX [Xylanivirga thermophila]|jgi:GTPase|uniref:GTPase HflX n=1 Tax=Xylanivirga thermophila TaxID=2496273 RepID=UPI0039F5BC0A
MQSDLIKERAILVGIDVQGMGEALLEELDQLADTAGAEVVFKMVQNRNKPDVATYIGKGKAEELSQAVKSFDAHLIICDDELSPAQIRNLEHITGIRVIDRTSVILDIFAQRAISREGKLQVELAQLKYRLPRLTGKGIELSRLGGGIGTRGPGEKKLETDRRYIRQRIYEIEKELKKVQKRRELARNKRKKNMIPVIALVGYTNAGKSTLMNTLTNSEVLVEDKLFATLDPTARKIVLPNNQNVVLVDTVGFINKLPHQLVDAFKATLEEVIFADVLLHIVDVSSPHMLEQIELVNSVLNTLGAHQPIIMVYNKIDKVNSLIPLPAIKPQVSISAKTGAGIDLLLKEIENNISINYHHICLCIPYDEANILSKLHDEAKVINQEYRASEIYLEVYVDDITYNQLKDFEV